MYWHFPNNWGPTGPGIGASSTIRKGDWKLIRSRMSLKKKDIEYELYDIRNDPGELNDLYFEEGEVVSELKLLLKKYIKQKRKPIIPEQLLEKTKEERKEEIKSLKSLGYM